MPPLPKTILKRLVLPPAGPLVLAAVALAVDADRLAGASLLVLALLMTPAVGRALIAPLERTPPWTPSSEGNDAEAIVVLDAGRLLYPIGADGPGFSAGAVVKPTTLARLRTAAEIARATGLPIFATGDGAGRRMADVLRDDFGAEARWIDDASRDTAESARQAAERLRGTDGPTRVVLVTDGWHLPRAVRSFERAGLTVDPAPALAPGADRRERGVLAWIPSVRGLQASHTALHEWLGLVVYRIRGDIKAPSNR